MPSGTGIWTPEEAENGHVFDYRLAQWLGQVLIPDGPTIDMGCGPGSYLRYLHDIGFSNLIGVEGTEIKGNEFANVVITDLTVPFDLEVKGTVICIEVAEHIPEQYTDVFLENITKHVYGGCDLIMSWGIPGQSGLGHVNCRHNIEVLEIMRKYQFKIDTEKSLKARSVVSNYAPWLRNTLLVFNAYGE